MLIPGVLPQLICSQIQKCLKWIREGGSAFFKKVSNSKKSQISDKGGGGQAYLGHCPKFSCFLIMTPPLSIDFTRMHTNFEEKGLEKVC